MWSKKTANSTKPSYRCMRKSAALQRPLGQRSWRHHWQLPAVAVGSYIAARQIQSLRVRQCMWPGNVFEVGDRARPVIYTECHRSFVTGTRRCDQLRLLHLAWSESQRWCAEYAIENSNFHARELVGAGAGIPGQPTRNAVPTPITPSVPSIKFLVFFCVISHCSVCSKGQNAHYMCAVSHDP